MEQMMGGGLFEGRHNMKLMYIRKKANNDHPKIHEEEDKESVIRVYNKVPEIHLWNWKRTGKLQTSPVLAP